MDGKPTTFWGKLRRDDDGGDVLEWHPLADHCADVAAVAEVLVGLPLWRKRLTRLAGRTLTETCWARVCVLAALHDIGKVNIGFQAKGRPELGTRAGHVREALGALFRRPGPFSCLDELAAWGDGATGLLISALCHHGRPYDATVAESMWQGSWWTPRGRLNPKEGAEDLLFRSRAWFPRAFETDGSELPDAPAFSHALAGVVMLADWVGSDNKFFPFSETTDGDRIDFSRRRAREIVAAMALDVPLGARTGTSGGDAFARVAPEGFLRRSAQSAMLELPHDQEGSITILEAETGSGKTEAVLARFVSLFEAGLVDGLYFALPTRSAATQMHRRVYESANRAFAKPPPVVLAVPTYLRVDDAEGRRLPHFEVLWPDSDRFRHRAWAAENAKRYLAGCIVVGTIDQVLLSALMVGHAHLRATALLRQLLVVDEVHASDAYMTRILEEVLARHRSAGGHAILLSATLGSDARTRLLDPGEGTPPPALADAEATPYPLISHRAGDDHRVAVSSDSVERAIHLNIRPWLENPEELAGEAVAAGMRGAKVLVIRNTVNDCVKTQIAVERLAERHDLRRFLFTCNGFAAPHHSLFARPDRQALDRALERRIGKDRPDGACIVVATQTVQQSLDLDADVLLTDLCPSDVLLQRLGRLHRHRRSRPAGFEKPRAFVIVPPRRDLAVLLGETGIPQNYHGLGLVYPDLRILEATWRLLEKHPEWRIPAMNRHLVESCLHPSILDAVVTEGGGRWQAHANHVMGAERGHRRHADLNLVDWSKAYADTSFPSSVDQRILTRLGEGDRRVRFPVPIEGPFGESVTELVLRPWWARGLSVDAEVEHVSTAEGVTYFRFGPTSFVYDRLGLRPDRTSSEEIAESDGP